MNVGVLELVAGPLRALRRTTLWWSIGLAGLVVATVAFWPAFRGSSGISDALSQLPSGVVQAFGLENFGTPAGYLRGNLYELFIPLLLALAGVALANSLTAGEETAGRLELYLAQPVDRHLVFAMRAVAAFIALAAIALVLAVVQFAADAAADLQIDAGYLVSTIVLCTLLGAVHGSVALAIAGLRARPSLVFGGGIGVALGGYVVAALFPLSSVLSECRHLSPWDWAFGSGPLEHATEPWRYVALAITTIVFAAIGVVSFGRRDIASG